MNQLESCVRAVKRGLGLSSGSALIGVVRPAYALMLRALYGFSGIERAIHGEPPLRLRPRYRGIAEDAEPAVFAALKARARPGAVVLDVGANVGMFSLLMARWVGDTGRVYAFEPAPESLRALRSHIRLNQLVHRVEAIGCAVSDTPGEAVFYAHASSGENSLDPGHARRVTAARPVRVPVTTVDAFCATRGLAPSLIKIDIEGFEFHALRGARETLGKHRPALVVEMHPHYWPGLVAGRAQAAALLADLGYRAVPLENQTDPLAEYGHVVLEQKL